MVTAEEEVEEAAEMVEADEPPDVAHTYDELETTVRTETPAAVEEEDEEDEEEDEDEEARAP